MPSKRDLKMAEYGISKYAYRELLNFCLQYPEKKERLRELHDRNYLLKPTALGGMPRGSSHSDPTANAAILASKLAADCELIEQTVLEVAPNIYAHLLMAVTREQMPYEVLRWRCGMVCGKNDYYLRRRHFFYRLAQKRGLS